MPKRVVSDIQPEFRGGLNLTGDESQLEPNEVRRAENARLTEFGGIKKRLGTQRIHATALPGPIQNGYSWQASAATTQLVIVAGRLYTGTYSVGMTWTARGAAADFSSVSVPYFVAFRDGSGECVYIGDGGALNKWNGTTVTTNIAGTPNVTQLAVYNRRLFGFSGDTLYWSALDNGDSLGNVSAGGGFARIVTFGLQDITAIQPVGGSLVIMQRNGRSRFTGWSQDDISIQQGTVGLDADAGTISPRSFVVVEGIGYWASDRAFFGATDQTRAETISRKVETILPSISDAVRANIIATYNKVDRELWFLIPLLGVYVYNTRLGAWTGPFNGTQYIDTTCMWQAVDSGGKAIILFGGQNGFVYLAEAGNYLDDTLSNGAGGNRFTLTVQCHRLFFGDPFATKSFRYSNVIINPRGSSSAQFNWFTDSGSYSVTIPTQTSGVWGSGVWGVGTWQTFGSLGRLRQFWGQGTFCDVTITDDGEGESVYSRVEINGFLMGRRR